ncbi:MAG: hypothetical protein KC713_09380 [Candidatus Omnitrophica bacterium]|nr:hypothetical protein [Candidatus Omnitrophota bacterium]
MERLRIVYSEINGQPFEYWYLERSESQRINELLKLIPRLHTWTPIKRITKELNVSTAALISSLRALRGALYIDKDSSVGNAIIARFPIVLVLKKSSNLSAIVSTQTFLRAPIYIKKP